MAFGNSNLGVNSLAVNWIQESRSATIDKSEVSKLNQSTTGGKWTKITFTFCSQGGRNYQREFQIKKVNSDGIESFHIREKSFLRRISPDFLIKSRYRRALSDSFHLMSARNQTLRRNPVSRDGVEVKSISSAELVSPLSDEVKSSRYYSHFTFSPNIKLQAQSRVTETDGASKNNCVAVYRHKQVPGRASCVDKHVDFEVNTVLSLNDVKPRVKTDNPVFVFDIDQVLVNHDHSLSPQKLEGYSRTETDIPRIFSELKAEYPNARFIALSSGMGTAIKLRAVGLSGLFNHIIDKASQLNSEHPNDKGGQLKALLKEQELDADEIVLVDDSLKNHQSMADAFSRENKQLTLIHYAGAIKNRQEASFHAEKNNQRMTKEDSAASDFNQDIKFTEKLIAKMTKFQEHLKNRHCADEQGMFGFSCSMNQE